jgi:hypothetical protein
MTPQDLVIYYQKLLSESLEIINMDHHTTQVEGYGILVEVVNEMRVSLYDYLSEGLKSQDPREVSMASYAMDELQASIEDVTE